MDITEVKKGQYIRVVKPVAYKGSCAYPPKGAIAKSHTDYYSRDGGFISLWDIAGARGIGYLGKGSEVEVLCGDELKQALDDFCNSCTEDQLPSRWGFYTGSDPEVFAVDENGEVIPARAFLCSEKQYCPPPGPRPVGLRKIFWDGFQAEFTVGEASCHAHLVDYIQEGLRATLTLARMHNPRASLTWKPVVDIPARIMESAPRDWFELGCTPSLNAYGQQDHLDGLRPDMIPFRFAGFHIHHGVGDLNKDGELCKRLVKAMDAIAGVVSVSLLRGMEDFRRRQYYGLAGEYRLPGHGLEWRVLSSAAIAHPVITHLLLDLSRYAGTLARAGIEGLWKASEEEVRETINFLSVDGALEILKRNERALDMILKCSYGANSRHRNSHRHSSQEATTGPKVWEVAKMLIFEGASAILPVGDMNKSWLLDATGDEAWAPHSESPNCCLSRLAIE